MIARALAVLLFAGAAGAASAPDWVRAAMARPVPAQPPRTAAVVLSDTTTLTFATSGDVTTQRRRVVKILTPAGREYAYGYAIFDDNTKLRTLRAWSVEPSGEVHAVRERDAVETSAASFELFTDAKMKFLDIPSEVGSVVAYEYETRERPYEPVTLWRFQESIPVLRARLEARVPAGWQHTAKWMQYPSVEPAAGPAWELTDVPAIPDEPRMPEGATVAGRMGVHWNAQRSWNDVATWYHGLAASRLAPTPALQAKTRELTGGAADPIRPLARFAQRDVRYVAVEIGIGGYQPHAAGEVFANRFGDCKDKATLLRAMLKEIGVESHYVLVHTTRGMVEPSFATVHAFNHVISAIQLPRERAKGLDAVIEHPRLGPLLLFDPTSTTTPLGQLPPYLQASRGLLVTPSGGELIELPSHAAESSALRRTAKLQLDASGTLRGSVEEVRTGAIAASMRAQLQPLSAAERVRFIESSLAHHLAQQTATDVKIENLDEPEAELVVRYSVAAPGYAKRVADMVLVRPRVLGAKGESAIATAERKHGYVTDGPSVQTDDVEIAVPLGMDELPKPVTVTTPHVQYASSSTFEQGVLRYTRRYAMKTWSVDRDALPALNDAFARIAADERASAVFK
jgi:transglutaminase-like putative cysteine protease